MDLAEEAKRYSKVLTPHLHKAPNLDDRYPLFLRRCPPEVLRSWCTGFCPSAWSSPLAGRVTLPICDPLGNVVALCGRRVDGVTRSKWTNSSFDKGNYLFGLHRAWSSIIRQNVALLVEGYGDVIALHHVGRTTAVGYMGSSVTRSQFQLLLRYCERVVILPDQDESGGNGAEKSVALAKKLGLQAYRIYTTEHYGDPDELAFNHPDLLERLLPC